MIKEQNKSTLLIITKTLHCYQIPHNDLTNSRIFFQDQKPMHFFYRFGNIYIDEAFNEFWDKKQRHYSYIIRTDRTDTHLYFIGDNDTELIDYHLEAGSLAKHQLTMAKRESFLSYGFASYDSRDEFFFVYSVPTENHHIYIKAYKVNQQRDIDELERFASFERVNPICYKGRIEKNPIVFLETKNSCKNHLEFEIRQGFAANRFLYLFSNDFVYFFWMMAVLVPGSEADLNKMTYSEFFQCQCNLVFSILLTTKNPIIFEIFLVILNPRFDSFRSKFNHSDRNQSDDRRRYA